MVLIGVVRPRVLWRSLNLHGLNYESKGSLLLVVISTRAYRNALTLPILSTMLEMPAPVPPRRRPGDGGTTDGRSVCRPPKILEDVEQVLWTVNVFRGKRV